MARFPESVLLKLPEGMLARIDAVSDNRSEFIRKAVIGALSQMDGDAVPPRLRVAPDEPVGADLRPGARNDVAPSAPSDGVPVPEPLVDVRVSSGTEMEPLAEKAEKPPAKPVAPAVSPSKRSGGIGFDERMAGLSARLSAGRASDCRVVVEALRERRMSERDLERALGWVGIRCQNAVMALMGAGVVSTESGLLGVVDEGL